MGNRNTKKYKYYIREEVHHKHYVINEPSPGFVYDTPPPIAITRPAFNLNRQIVF